MSIDNVTDAKRRKELLESEFKLAYAHFYHGLGPRYGTKHSLDRQSSSSVYKNMPTTAMTHS
jgi:hypothetical protein